MKNLIYYLGVAGIIILSFFCYSSNFYPLLGSDDAIQVLMIYYFKLPHDLYFWGQDRYGSLIPLIGQVFFHGFGVSALTSESITHYLLLIAGYFAFAAFFKSRFSRLILAIAWFFPPFRLTDFLRGNIGLEYSLLAIGIFLLNKLSKFQPEKPGLKKHLHLFCISLIFILAVWVSDLAAFSVFLIIILQVYSGISKSGFSKKAIFSLNLVVYYFIAGIICGSAFIVYGKHYAEMSPSYNQLNDLSTLLASLMLFANSVTELLTFTASEPFTSAYLYMILLLTVPLFVVRRQVQFTENQRKWFSFFVLDCILIFGVIMLSKWSFLNGIPRRYFTSNYITFWMAFLLAFEYLAETDFKKIMRVVLFIAAITAGAGSIYNLKYIWPKSLKPRVEYVREFESLGKIGIIGNYWNSYINSVTNPGQIIATPDDLSSVRNRAMAYELMKRETFYIIRDGWMEYFPDSINQFGTPLYKNGNEFRMGDCNVCSYRK